MTRTMYLIAVAPFTSASCRCRNMRFRGNNLQLLPAEGLAERLKKSSEEYGIFFYCGLLSAGMIATFGFLAPFFPVWPSTGVRVVILCGEFLTVSADLFFHSWYILAWSLIQASPPSLRPACKDDRWPSPLILRCTPSLSVACRERGTCLSSSAVTVHGNRAPKARNHPNLKAKLAADSTPGGSAGTDRR